MAKHRVTPPPREAKRADAQFSIERDGKKIGTLEISNGSLVWFPPYANHGYKMSWKKFDEVVSRNATRIDSR